MTGKPPVRFGLLRLADSAPAVVALQRGLFSELGLTVELSVEPSWANIVDKLAYGLLDAAAMLPPLALAAALGLRGPPARLLVPMGLSGGGNTITVRREVADAIAGSAAPQGAMAKGRALGEWLHAQPAPPRFAVVHAFSTHNLLLRYWLAASGVDPDRDIATVVIAPEQVEAALADGRIVGFCAGAPWGELAERNGSGRHLMGTSDVWANHPEKCVAVAEPWANANPLALQRLLRGLLQAQRLCEQPGAADWVAHLLAGQPLRLPVTAVRACLPGGSATERIRFRAGLAWYPRRSQAIWFLTQMRRWGWVGSEIDLPAAAGQLYRPDLLAAAADAEGLAWPDTVTEPDGGFCDGAISDRTKISNDRN
ncbi:MAG TPA: CmpA/NrtA family ABC transporter substrate-binding protein [Acetobacteraceae bacterium]|nr:CmpA/NrtA family ABC transporter substrate-binding protein [Acetobacteraceae bacterium]